MSTQVASMSRSRSRSRQYGRDEPDCVYAEDADRHARKAAMDEYLDTHNPYSTLSPDYCPLSLSHSLACSSEPKPSPERKRGKQDDDPEPSAMHVDQQHTQGQNHNSISANVPLSGTQPGYQGKSACGSPTAALYVTLRRSIYLAGSDDDDVFLASRKSAIE